MNIETTKRESEKIKELVREYKKKGFDVIMEPSEKQLPNFMRNLNYYPDLIATSDKERLVIEVKSSRTIAKAKDFSHIADYIRKQEGWDFILVMTNPKEKHDINTSGLVSSSEHVIDLFEQAEKILASGKSNAFNNASFLIAWAGVEAAIRHFLISTYKTDHFKGVQTLMRDAVIYGIVSRKDGDFLESIINIRNSLVHGIQGTKVFNKQVRRLIRIGKTILSELQRQSSPNKGMKEDAR